MDGVTYQLGVPFMVIATQNLIEHEAPIPCSEAQRDRFMLELNIGYLTRQAEIEILETPRRDHDPASATRGWWPTPRWWPR